MIANNNNESLSAQTSNVQSGADVVFDGGSERPYFGKCQYKTGKCFNERTLKRNGDAHSLCEEHRIKQNLIQRRSDRKYQTVHAVRRRERSQRRAVLKKQVSMAVAQQLFFEHQQQKSNDTQQLSSGHSLSTLLSSTEAPMYYHHEAVAQSIAATAHVPSKMDLSHFVDTPGSPYPATDVSSSILSSASPAVLTKSERKQQAPTDGASASGERKSAQMLQQRRKKQRSVAAVHMKEEDDSPTGIDDFAPDSFLTICASDADSDAAYASLVPIVTAMGEKKMWTEDDIEFLQSLLLA